MSDVFKALAHPVRRDVLRALRDGPQSAGELAGRYPVSKPTMSGHFASLKAAGLIIAERHGTTIVYRLNASVADEALGWLMDLVGKRQGDSPEQEEE
ncbi:metalloregulator ArsR/SmtB family transcription factor [uncultured Maricaulis sp.]|uniref:metalloregulator ArsR/SmtB family transcription factor n=1 Tax=uncultured Maricaulis sp. TaxID=174710 RepID=UPI00262FA7AE|nr:metalloregulator ArsR/SmtB family transcription factor [uncultured Maricaulis sp.]